MLEATCLSADRFVGDLPDLTGSIICTTITVQQHAFIDMVLMIQYTPFTKIKNVAVIGKNVGCSLLMYLRIL